MISRLFSNDSFNCFELSVSTEFPNWITFSVILGKNLLFPSERLLIKYWAKNTAHYCHKRTLTLNYQVIYKEKLACGNCLVWKHYSKCLQKLKDQCWFSALDWIFCSKNFYMERSTKTFLAFVFLFFFVTDWNFTFILFKTLAFSGQVSVATYNM